MPFEHILSFEAWKFEARPSLLSVETTAASLTVADVPSFWSVMMYCEKKINEFVNSRKVGHSTVGPHQPPLLFKEGDCDQQLSRYQNIKKQFLYHRKNYIFTPVRIRISDKVNCTNSRIHFPISVTHLEWKMLKSGFISHNSNVQQKGKIFYHF